MFFLFNLKYVSTSGGLYSSDVPLYFFIENYLLFFIDFQFPNLSFPYIFRFSFYQNVIYNL